MYNEEASAERLKAYWASRPTEPPIENGKYYIQRKLKRWKNDCTRNDKEYALIAAKHQAKSRPDRYWRVIHNGNVIWCNEPGKEVE